MHDPGLVAVALQQRFAVGEEGGVGKAVVFEDHCFFGDGESPVQAGGDALPAAQVLLGEVGEHFARPVHALGDDFAHLGHARGFARHVRPRPVADDKQLRRTRLPDALKHTAHRLRAVEDEEYDRGLHRIQRASGADALGHGSQPRISSFQSA